MKTDEFFGGSYRTGAMVSSFVMSKPMLLVINPTTSGLTVTLPPEDSLIPGIGHVVIVNESSTDFVTVLNEAGTGVGNVSTNTTIIFSYNGGLTANGWFMRASSFAQVIGGSVPADTDDMDIVVAQNTENLNIYNAAVARGWDEVTPLTVRVTINPQVSVYSRDVNRPALFSGDGWPANSLIILLNNGYIVGRGGDGGRGGVVAVAGSAGAGGNGGAGIWTLVDILIINSGLIAGGGGGGGGGDAPLTPSTSGNHGGGGGGGCPGGRGGLATPGAIAGENSELFIISGRQQSVAFNTMVTSYGGENAAGANTNGHGGAGGLPGADGITGNTTTSTPSVSGTPGLSGDWMQRPTAVNKTYINQGGTTAGTEYTY